MANVTKTDRLLVLKCSLGKDVDLCEDAASWVATGTPRSGWGVRAERRFAAKFAELRERAADLQDKLFQREEELRELKERCCVPREIARLIEDGTSCWSTDVEQLITEFLGRLPHAPKRTALQLLVEHLDDRDDAVRLLDLLGVPHGKEIVE